MKALFIAAVLCFSASLAYPQSCPPNTVFQGVQMPVIQIRNQCFFYDNSGTLLEQALASMINVRHDLGDGGQLSDVSFVIRSSSIDNYQHMLNFDGCNPREEITFRARIDFESDAKVLLVPVSIDGIATAQVIVQRWYNATLSEMGTSLQVVNTTANRSSLDIDASGFASLFIPLLEPYISEAVFGNEFVERVPSIFKLNDTIVPFGPEMSGPSTICENSVTLSVPDGFDRYLWSTGSTSSSIDVDEPGTYTVRIEHACNVATLSRDVVQKDPIADFIVTDLLCGDRIRLSAPGFQSVQWSTGENTMDIQVEASGLYEATATDADGCEGRDKVNLNIQGPCMMALNVHAICSDRPASFRRWVIFNPNAMAVRIDWEIPGTLQRAWMDVPPGEATLTTSTARFNTNGITVYWHDQNGELQAMDAAGTEEKCPKTTPAEAYTPSAVSLYPNPTKDYFLISFDSDVETDVPFEIRTHTGVVRDQGSFLASAGKNYIHYDVSTLASGDYIMTVANETIRFVKK